MESFLYMVRSEDQRTSTSCCEAVPVVHKNQIETRSCRSKCSATVFFYKYFREICYKNRNCLIIHGINNINIYITILQQF